MGGPSWGAEPQTPATPPEQMSEPPETPQVKPPEPLGYVPGALPPSPGYLDAGPNVGILAPYGNPGAFDTLLRGWHTRKIGAFQVTPFFEADGLYRSNIFQTTTDKKSDFITLLTPGLRVELPVAGRHRLSLGYLGAYYIYSKYSENSHYDQNISLDAMFNLRSGLTLRMGNMLRLATEEQNSDFSRQRRYTRTTPYLTASYALADRWKAEAAYQYDTLIFTEAVNDVNNYNQHNTSLTLYYRFLPKTAALIQYIFTYRTYPDFSVDNNYSHSPLVGLTWDPSAKLSGTVKFGYTFKTYETEQANRNNSPDGWACSVQLLYRLDRSTNITLTGQRSFQDDADYLNSPYTSSGVWLTLNREWHYLKLASYATFYYINNDYLNRTIDPGTGTSVRRDDNLVGAGVGLSRSLTRWLRARLDYNYTNRASNFFGYGYNEHRFMFGLQTSF